MIITICGSMKFAQQMLDAQEILQNLGHQVYIPIDTKNCIENPDLNIDWQHCEQFDVTKDHFNKVKSSDAILVLNYDKNNIKNYIGGSSLMEMGIAYHFNKSIFLLNDCPDENDLSYAFEIKFMKPIILNGSIEKIKDFM